MSASDGMERHRPALDAAIDRLRAFAPVERVILFGSRARGDHASDSDWDICVLLDDDIPPGTFTARSMWEVVRDLGLTIQVLPMRRSVFEAKRFDINAMAYDMARDGVVLYDGPARPRR